MNCAKTVEMIEMTFEISSQVDPRNHILDRDTHPSMETGNFERNAPSTNMLDDTSP